MKNPVTIFLMCSWAGCSGDPAGSDSDTDAAIDTGTPSSDLPKIWVNEVMPANATGLQDEVGAFPDWIELFNPNADAVDISGWWLTEDTTDIFKWQFAEDTSIPAGGFLVVFADNDPEEGPLHASFKLAASGGDDVALYGPNVRDNPLVDSIEDLQPVLADLCLARSPDGGPTWIVDDTPTPGTAND